VIAIPLWYKHRAEMNQPFIDCEQQWCGMELPSDDRRLQVRGQRQPAVWVAVCVAAGILADRFGTVPWTIWISVAAAAVVGWLACLLWKRPRMAAVLLLLSAATVAGARHHQYWSVTGTNDLAQYATVESQLVRLSGVVSEQPLIRHAGTQDWQTATPLVDQSRCIVVATSLETNAGEVPVSGRVRLTVKGHLLHVAVGDKVAISGWLSLPMPAGNPGQFDFRDSLRRQQCRCLLFANHPDAVRKLRDGGRNRPARLLAEFREQGERLCVAHLDAENIPLATALLLGDRSRMTGSIRTSFAESGTAHLLAISGLHVGILAALLWLCCRLCHASPRTTALVIVASVLFYAVISGGRPPVARATVFVLITVGGFLLKRPAVAMNTLALAAIAILAWNPSDLFDVGTQLSFLAVTGMILAREWRIAQPPTAEQPAAELFPANSTAMEKLNGRIRSVGGWLLRGYAMMLGIWFLTLPLTGSQFHLISPVGFLINVLLIPFVCILLWSGFAFLIVGSVVPYAAIPLGSAFDVQLSGLRGIVDFAADIHLGHLYGPGPAAWWMAVYYLLVTAMVFIALKRMPARRTIGALMVWTVAGLAIGLVPQHRDGLRCTVLDVGHGCSVLLEMPNGKTLLYDAGALTDAKRAEWTVENAMWSRGISRLDAVVASHADVDHFNGMHGLLATVPVGTVMLSQTFLDFDQRAVRELCGVIEQERIPVRLLQEGDRLLIDETVTVSVLHPPGNRRFDNDNENSLVLMIEYAGRRILLTGDLEKDGNGGCWRERGNRSMF
jgi:competence protein ComEC